MQHSLSSTRTRYALIGPGIFALVCASARMPAEQTASTPGKGGTHTVPLTSDACPQVRAGDSVAFDWNPGFDPSSAVSGLHALRLTFDRVGANGVIIHSRYGISLGRDFATSISSLGNGYFHIEVPLRGRIAPGAYRLVGAQAIPQLQADYRGPAPQMTISPVRELYCITVVPATQP